MENNDKKVSVIIPIYNAEKHLRECLKSLERQTLDGLEFIMVNDGSTDSSRSICEEFASRDNRFELINQDNHGLAAARRNGMLHATGEYIGFVDSDDWVETDMYEKMYATAVKHDVDIVFCNCWRDDGEKSIKNNKYIRCGFYDRKQIIDEILPRTLAGLDEKGRTHVIRWANWLRIFRHELIRKHQIYNDPRFRRCQDLQLTFEATLHANSYYYLGDDYLYHNRVVGNSLSRGYTKDFWKNLRPLIETLYKDVDEFDELNLKEQMDLCAFFFAVNACANEMKKNKSISKQIRMENLKEICNDDLSDVFLKTIPVERLHKINKVYYRGLKEKNIKLLKKANYMTILEQKRKQVVARLFSVQWIYNLYIKSKGRK